METEELLKSLSVREKLFQMFILGFAGKIPCAENMNIQKAIQAGLAGVILFSENIHCYEQTVKLTESLQKTARVPLFISIDQEGGRVERTVNIKNKINYLSPAELAAAGNSEYAQIQAHVMSEELKFMGINMNFAPVMDVNTNKNKSIIGSRSFSDNPEKVIELAKPFYHSFMKNSVIPVIKHFPGHGATGEDSHLTMPVVDMAFEKLESIHIKPFIQAIKDGVNAIMVNHVHYRAFNDDPIPASLSKIIVSGYLRKKLGFQGLVVSDDMVMGGVQNYFDSYEACLKGIHAGIDLFIFKYSSDETLKIMEKLHDAVTNGDLSEERIDESVRRILLCKKTYNFWQQRMTDLLFKPEILQKKIDKIRVKE